MDKVSSRAQVFFPTILCKAEPGLCRKRALCLRQNNTKASPVYEATLKPSDVLLEGGSIPCFKGYSSSGPPLW